MSAVIRLGVLLLLITSCQSKDEAQGAPRVQGEQPYFTSTEVIATLNALVAIIDWPSETFSHQKNLNVTPQVAQKLMLPLHAIYDEKIAEAAGLIPGWDKNKIATTISGCAANCECDFYQEVLDRHPDLLETAAPELKSFAGQKIVKTKESVLACLQKLPSIQNLLNFLRSDLKNYEAESVI